jgi:hypothetical protein
MYYMHSTSRLRFFKLLFRASLCVLGLLGTTVSAQNVYIVKDTSDLSVTTAGGMTLRGAVSLVNANTSGIPDTVRFDIDDSKFPFVFSPVTTYTLGRPIFIEGYTQGTLDLLAHTDPAKVAAPGPIGQRKLQIIISAARVTSPASNPVFSLYGPGGVAGAGVGKSVISGLVINNLDRGNGKAFDFPSFFDTLAGGPLHIWGCYFNTSANGITAAPATSMSGTGGNTIFRFDNATVIKSPVYIGVNGDGLNDANEGNLISNAYYGITINTSAASTEYIHIAGNYMGTNATCATATDVLDTGITMLPTASVYLKPGGAGNVIVGVDNATSLADTLKRNILSGTKYGIMIYANTLPVVIAGNYIGVAKDGKTPIPNRNDYTGLPLAGGAGTGIYTNATGTNAIRIGSDANSPADSLERNIISGNQTWGVSLSGANHVVAGNYIGTDRTGLIGVPNGGSGIAGNNDVNTGFIIGVSPTSTLTYPQFERNVISGNGQHGIAIRGDNHVIAGNYIGVGSNGVTALGNGQTTIQPGIFITAATTTGKKNRSIRIGTSGGSAAKIAAERNIIAYNKLHGISFNHASYATIAGNYIGIDKNKNAAGNAGVGIWMIQSDSSVIGAPSGTYAPALANIISNNGESGVALSNGGGAGTPYGASRRIRISQNSFYRNKTLSIDLARYPLASGSRDNKITANDGATIATDDNNGIDYPIFTTYSALSGAITVTGFLGKCGTDSATAGTTLAGSFTIELYAEDSNGYTATLPTTDECKIVGTAHGEGKTYLGSLNFTGTGSGYTFSGTVIPDTSIPLSAYVGKKLTGIAIDPVGNTSEFGTRTGSITSVALPLGIVSFSGSEAGSDNLLQWEDKGTDVAGYELEYSTDGAQFAGLGFIGVHPGNDLYDFRHRDVTGSAFYRLKRQAQNGSYTYSNTIRLLRAGTSAQMQVLGLSPIPFSNSLQLALSMPAQGMLTLSLSDLSGRICFSQQLQVNKGTGTYSISGLETLPPGIYMCKLSDTQGQQQWHKVVKQ